MTNRFPEILRLKQLDANKTELRQFAIDQAMHLLISAGVEGVITNVELAIDSTAFEAPQSVKGFLKRTRQALKPPVSQEEMAHRAGLAVSTYQAIEQGKKISSGFGVDSLARAAAAVGLSDEEALWFTQSLDPSEIVPDAIKPTLAALLPVYRNQIQENGQILRTIKRRSY